MPDLISKLLVFDCDSTLSSIEGIDELAALRGPEVLKACEQMTLDAMEGRIPIESIFAERLKQIRPTQEEVAAIGQRYVDTVEPCAAEILPRLREEGWELAIVSGGFLQAIEPLAALLKIDRIAAVPLFFEEDGSYAGFESSAPTTRNGGKPDILRQWRLDYSIKTLVMVGDGSSDLETKGTADLFVGFGRYIRRAKVESRADAFILSLADLPGCLKEL